MKRLDADGQSQADPPETDRPLSASRLAAWMMSTRGLIAWPIGQVAGIAGLAAAAGATGSSPVAIGVGIAIAGLATWAAATRLVAGLDETAASRGLKAISVVAAVAAVVQLARLAVFMLDPSQAGCSVVPSSEWERRHSCLSAYFVAAEAAQTGGDVYDPALYSVPSADAAARRVPRTISAFNVDVYEYPPPFLLLPRALGQLAPDFVRMRMLWFGLNCGLVLLAIVFVARSLGPAAGTRALLLSPLVFAALPTISTLQKGNVQFAIVASSVLAMLLFGRRASRPSPVTGVRHALGGLLLAFATLSKIYPGMLLLYLLARRQWRALFWTGAFCAVLLGLSLADTGWAPFEAFTRHLPGLLGGEAFPALRNPAAMAINHSVPGLVLKLQLFGVAGASFGAAKIVGWAYTLFLVWAVVALGTRHLRGDQAAKVWLTVVFLATLRSPFLPQTYAVFPSLWALTLVAATAAPSAKTLAWTLLGWAALFVYVPVDLPLDPRVKALVALVPQAATIAIAALCVRRAAEASVRSWQPALEPA